MFKSFSNVEASSSPWHYCWKQEATSDEGVAAGGEKLLGAPGLTTRSKKLLVAKGIATSSNALVTTSKALVSNSFFVTTSKAPVTTRVALVTASNVSQDVGFQFASLSQSNHSAK